MAHVRASVQRQSNVAAEEPCLVCLIQSYLKNVVFALRRCSFAPCLKALQIHPGDNLVGRFSLRQRFHRLLQGKRQCLCRPHHFNAHELAVCPGYHRSVSPWFRCRSAIK
ncbi:Hypothetical protein B819_98601 [Klebsiella pneumoniae subsp. pneumoniae KpQ3]|nr:hypothetical protein HMPREF9538_02936 [Klebsiella sp. MS 92-3]EKF80752.1 Hypothetical protein B819_98601 [Klebsiella pneumoniae subsp. pneumoniae KpQ3]